MTIDERPRLEAEQHAVLGPLVRVIKEAADEQPWAIVGAAATHLQGVAAPSLASRVAHVAPHTPHATCVRGLAAPETAV